MNPEVSQSQSPSVTYIFPDAALEAALPIVEAYQDAMVKDEPENIKLARDSLLREQLLSVMMGSAVSLEARNVRTGMESLDEYLEEDNIVDALRATTEDRLAKARKNIADADTLVQLEKSILAPAYRPEHEVPTKPLRYNVTPSDTEIVTLFESRKGVKHLPTFAQQSQDETRTAVFSFAIKDRSKTRRGGDEVLAEGEMTEQEGLLELRDYLENFIPKGARSDSGKHRGLAREASSMNENLSFIGDREYKEAVDGLATVWKKYLDDDPERKICVLTEVCSLVRYHGCCKSDSYLRDSILDSFTDEELEQYSGRIVTSLSDLEQNPVDKTRVIMLDDWSISGQQMRDTYKKLLESNEKFASYVAGESVEINLIVGSKDRLKDGLALDPHDASQGSIPVRSYFLSHYAKNARKEHRSHVSGLHSSVNYDFRTPCDMISQFFNSFSRKDRKQMPALTDVVRPYAKGHQRVSVSRVALMRVPESGDSNV